MGIVRVWIGFLVFALCLPVISSAEETRWRLRVERADGQPERIEVLSEEDFRLAVKVDLVTWADAFTSFETRPRTLTYYLLDDWNGIDYETIYGGKKIGTTTAPGLKEDPIWASVNAVTIADRPRLTAPFEAGTFYVSACIPRGAGGGQLGEHLGRLANILCSEPVQLQVSARPRPDLVPSTFRTSSAVRRIAGPEGVLLGDKIILRSEALNAGDARARTPTRMRFYLLRPSDRRSTVDPERDVVLKEMTVPRLRPDESKILSATVEGPPSPGEYRYAVCIAPIGGVRTRESNPDNNCSRATTVRVQRPAGACVDLAITEVQGLEPAKDQLEIYTLGVTVENLGNKDAASPAVVKIQKPGRLSQESSATTALAVGATEGFRYNASAPERSGPSAGRVCVHSKEDCNKRNDCLDFEVEVN